MVKLRRCLRLGNQSLARVDILPRLFRVQDLERYRAAKFDIVGQVHGPHSAGAEFPFDLIGTQASARSKIQWTAAAHAPPFLTPTRSRHHGLLPGRRPILDHRAILDPPAMPSPMGPWGTPLTGNSWPGNVDIEGQPAKLKASDRIAVPLRSVTRAIFNCWGCRSQPGAISARRIIVPLPASP